MLTRKHFEAVAAELKAAKDEIANSGEFTREESHGATWALERITRAFIEYAESENPRFDRRTFLRACGQ